MENVLVFSGRSNKNLTQKICKKLKQFEEIELGGNVEIKNFPSGEIYCQYQDNIRGKDVFIVQSTNNPNQDWMELFILIQSARLASASKIIVVIPYFSYSRQDRKNKPRTPISAKLMLDLLEKAGTTRIITLDIHNIAIQGFSSIPFDSLLPCNLLIDYFKKNLLVNKRDLKKWIIFSPDVGGVKKIEKYADVLGTDFGMIHKKRIDATNVEQKTLIGNVKNKNVLLIDDMSESLNTLSGAAKLLKSKGAKQVVSFVTHLPLTDDGLKNLEKEQYIDLILTTNSVDGIPNNKKIKQIDISNILSEAISRTMNNKSISSLFEIKGF
jgi:ribose-phosphate pyrophosphokinase